jgi:hypothetical protein
MYLFCLRNFISGFGLDLLQDLLDGKVQSLNISNKIMLTKLDL